MKKRPLYMLCLTFLIVKCVLLVFIHGETLGKVPPSSIFFEQKQRQEILIQGQVYKKRNTSNVQILHLKNNSIFQENNSYYESNIIIYDDTFAEISIGKEVCIRGEKGNFEKARNPGNFDQQLYYARQNIYGFVWCQEIISVSGEENKFLEWLYEFREMWKQTILSNMSEKNGHVLNAMLLAEKSEMDAELKELYQKNGLSHLLAISGLHISFIGLGIYRVLRKTGVSYIGSGICAIMILSVYVLMIGFSVSVIRAYIMLLLRMGADIVGRVYDMQTALMLAAALIVLYQPLYLTDAAFYMSHGAILGLVFVLPEIKKIFSVRIIWLEGCYASVAINVTLFPVLLWFYYEFPLYSIFMNMAAIPLMTGVIGLGMFGSLGVLCFNPVGGFLLKLCDWILLFLEWFGEMGCRLPLSCLVFGKPNWWEVVIYYLLLIVEIIILKKCKTKPVIGKIKRCSLLWLVLIILMFIKFPDGQVKVAMLDVGQGDCIYIKGPQGQTYLIDGGSSDVDQVGKYRIEPFLKSQGVGTVDYIFVSHGDLDHYSGVVEMIERQTFGVKIDTLVMPANYKQDEKLLGLSKLAQQHGIDVVVIGGGQSILEGELRIRCVQPMQEETMLEGNEGSMVLEISFGVFDMLFTGDVEGEGEKQLEKHLMGKSYDVLKVAHHGSKNSTTESFIKMVKPKIALISAGEDNSYGHPHIETIKRLKEGDCKIYQTIERGAIMMKTDGDFIDIFPSSI